MLFFRSFELFFCPLKNMQYGRLLGLRVRRGDHFVLCAVSNVCRDEFRRVFLTNGACSFPISMYRNRSARFCVSQYHVAPITCITVNFAPGSIVNDEDMDGDTIDLARYSGRFILNEFYACANRFAFRRNELRSGHLYRVFVYFRIRHSL